MNVNIQNNIQNGALERLFSGITRPYIRPIRSRYTGGDYKRLPLSEIRCQIPRLSAVGGRSEPIDKWKRTVERRVHVEKRAHLDSI